MQLQTILPPVNDKPSAHEAGDYEEASVVEEIPYQPSEKASSVNNNRYPFLFSTGFKYCSQ